MDEDFQECREAFIRVVASLDDGIVVTIPTRPSNGLFQTGLQRGNNKKFLGIQEDDLLDLPDEEDIRALLTEQVQAINDKI